MKSLVTSICDAPVLHALVLVLTQRAIRKTADTLAAVKNLESATITLTSDRERKCGCYTRIRKTFQTSIMVLMPLA
jgi:hypothetical protein